MPEKEPQLNLNFEEGDAPREPLEEITREDVIEKFNISPSQALEKNEKKEWMAGNQLLKEYLEEREQIKDQYKVGDVTRLYKTPEGWMHNEFDETIEEWNARMKGLDEGDKGWYR